MTQKRDITVIILSYNEAIHIERCINRILPHVRRVVVIDSFSEDRTVELAQSAGAEVYQNKFTNQAEQLTWALRQIQFDTEWVFRLDSDEYLDEKALEWIGKELLGLDQDVGGVAFRLKVIFQKKHIRFGGYYSTNLLRLWRSGRGRIEQRWMDERTLVEGSILTAPGNLIDENLNSIGWWTSKHNNYATRHVADFLMLRYLPEHRAQTSGKDLPARARIKRFLRNRVYTRIPLYVRPILYWAYRYFILLGFLDGRKGLIWHFLHGCWYYMLIDTKIEEASALIDKEGLDALTRKYKRDYNIKINLVPSGGD